MIPLIRFNCGFLRQGVDLLEKHDAESFAKTDPRAFDSSIGSHLRHVADHYRSFLKGVDTGIIDYDDRDRDRVSEKDIEAAKREIEEIIRHFRKLEDEADRPVDVKVSSSAATEEDEVSKSSLARELQFLVSHTVHHYALIAIISRMGGVEPGDSFGVAPSTLKYMQAANC